MSETGIENGAQRIRTLEWITKFEAGIKEIEERKVIMIENDALFAQLQIDSYRSMIETLNKQIENYDKTFRE